MRGFSLLKIKPTGKSKKGEQMENEKTVWASSVTEQMVAEAGLNDNEISMLVEALNDAVMEVCLNYSITG